MYNCFGSSDMLSNQAENHSCPEKETGYSGVVNLSGRHLKRIECLPKGISPSTLLLSNNEISRVENLQYFVHLQQLSLAGNHIVDIEGISAALNLRVLDLSNNSIVAIEVQNLDFFLLGQETKGVSALRNLEWLNLSGNSIEKIENLDRNNNLHHLDLSDNSIAVISGLRTLKKLKTLLLHGNLLSSLAVINDQVSNTVCTLSLADNEISDLNEITHLSSLVNLEQLSLINNPCVLPNSAWRLEVNYRPYLVYCCDTLRNLDGHLVNNQERMIARLLDQAFSRIGHPTLGQHVQLVSILHHICTDPTPITQTTQEDAGDELDGDTLLESESFYLPVPSSDMEEETESDDAIMTEEEAIRLFSLAATIVQAHVRGYLVRKKFDFCRYRRRNYAAACIQAAWKGYCARTRDIKVVNIRNELRIRRLISLINNLYNTLEREHDDAVKSREQLKSAIKYLWYQVTEQKKLNQIQLHKEQVKAAIKIQAWWRGCMCKKAFPHKNVNKDKVTMLFSLCRSLQMQLDAVTSRINEITKGTKQSKESLPEEQTDSEGQSDQFYDTFGQLDSSEDTISPLRDSQINYSAARASETTVQRIDAKLSASDVKSSEDTQGEKAGDLKALENDLTKPSQTESKEEFVGSDVHVPLHSNIAQAVPSLADQTEHGAHEISLANLPNMEVGSSKEISSFDREERKKEDASSLDIVHTERDDSDEKPSLDGAKDLKVSEKTNSTNHEGNFQEQVRTLSPLGQKEPRSETEAQEPQSETEALELQSETEAQEPQSETEACEPQSETEARASGGQINTLDKDSNLFEGLPTSIVVSEVSEPTDKATNEAFTAVETLHVDIPEIFVSSPVPTDDEGSDAVSAVESDANDEVQGDGEDSGTQRQDAAETQSDLVSTGSSNQETENRKTEADTFTVETKQKVDISKNNLPESNLPFGSATVFSASEELTSEQPGTEVPADQPSATVAQESVPNLGERASSLLTQLRSEIASMKTARLSGVTSDGDGNATDMSQLRDTSQPAVQERDTTEPTVKYHLPLFEDLDSACTSFSLDDFLNDPAFEENADSALETDNKYNGEEY